MDIPLLHMTLPEIIRSVGYLGIFLIVFVESGVPFGVVLPLPGDTLLFSAGLLAAVGTFSLIPLMVTVFLGALFGASAGYWFGTTFGPKLFTKEDAWFMNPRTLARAEEFFAKYGRRALIFARFLPVLRTLVPVAAGIGRMEYGTFLRWNALGALLWTLLVTLLGYYLGQLIPNVDRYLLPALIVIIVLSSLGVIREVLAARGR